MPPSSIDRPGSRPGLDLPPIGRPGSLLGLLLALGVVFSAAGCPQTSAEPDQAAGAAPPTDEAGEPPALEVPYDGRIRLVTARFEHGDHHETLAADEVLELPEDATLYLETWQRLEDHRVRLVTGPDRLVPFSLETGPVTLRDGPGRPEPGGTWLRLKPAQALRPGVEYEVRIEPEIGARITDAEGREYDDLILALRRVEPDPDPVSAHDEADSGSEPDAGP